MGLRGQWAGICTWGLTCCHHWCARPLPFGQLRKISLSRACIEAAMSSCRFARTVTVSSRSCNRREKGASSFASSRSICADSSSLPKPGGGNDKASSGSSSSASSAGSSSWACGPAAEEALVVAVEDVAVRLATDRPSSQPREYCVPAVSCLEHPCRQHRAPSLFHLLCETGWPHGMSAGGVLSSFSDRISFLLPPLLPIAIGTSDGHLEFFLRHLDQAMAGSRRETLQTKAVSRAILSIACAQTAAEQMMTTMTMMMMTMMICQ